jgi:AcrR family transcriptional regulator
VRAAVLDAVQAELVEHGYDGLTIDGVAARSGVHRATLYRRWTDVGGMLADVLRAAAEAGWAPPDTGSLADDLAALNRQVHEALTAQPSVTAAIIAASFRSPQAASALRAFWADRYARSAVVVERAIARGEIPAGTEPMSVIVAATAPVYHHLVLLGEPLTAATAEKYARAAAQAWRHTP